VARRSGLGRGLSALIPAEVPGERDAAFREIPVSQIVSSRHQPRHLFDEESLGALTASIRQLGVLQPVLVRPTEDDRYELIAGERRWRAAKRAGLQTVPAVVKDVDDTTSLESALVENLHRDDLNPMEEAAAYQQLIEQFSLTHEEVATRVGKSRAAITNALRLFQLPPAVQRLVADGQLSAGHARAILGSPDRAFQETLARRAVAESLAVRQLEDAVRAHAEAEADVAPSDTAEAVNAHHRLRPPGLLELEELLSHHLDTRVAVTMGARKGRVVIDFADLADLERIYRAITSPRTSADGGAPDGL
jgi:ParB family transcriptional regulator, chromosome partitioning protein